MSREERVAQIEHEASDLPLTLQADLLGISRSSLYYQPRPPSCEEISIKHRIDEIYTDYPFYGSRKMAAQLQREGMEVNRKAVQRAYARDGYPSHFSRAEPESAETERASVSLFTSRIDH